ncbi:MAG: InlB B-repeat-containing protein, partial [Clostridia bacterium]|nr:InlB B-repeat-containing protein [Clostridia bacterium]
MTMLKDAFKRFIALSLVTVMILSMLPLEVFAATNWTETESAESVISGNFKWKATTKIFDNKPYGSASFGEGSLTITAETRYYTTSGACGSTEKNYDESTVTVVLKDSTSEGAIISFSYDLSGINSGTVTIAGTKVTSSGEYTTDMSSVEIVLTSPVDTEGEAKLVLSNLNSEINTSRSMTVKTGVNGKVNVNGIPISKDTTETVQLSTGLPVSAVANSGYKFLAWVDASNKVLATTSAATIKPIYDGIEVSALFVPDNENGHWLANDEIYTDFQKALDAAEAGNKSVKLMNSATLSKDYTIPAGVSVLVPYDQALTAYGSKPLVVQRPSTPPTPKVYSTLTIDPNVVLTVNGSLEVSASHLAAHGGQIDGGRPYEYYGYITMGANSHIDVQSGGTLYAWGYITGAGKVTANSGATIYEKFQVSDYRGGGITSIIVPAGVFPFNQYYVQNIEVEECIMHGASLICHAGIFMSELTEATINFIGGSESMFSIEENGRVIKKYDNGSDRLIIIMDGNGAMNPISLMDYNTANFVLPVNNNITVNVVSGKTIMNQDLMMMPGAEVNIGREAYLELASGKKVYLMDKDNWGNFCFGKPMQQISWVPLKKAAPDIRTADNMTDAKVNINGTVILKGQMYASTAGALIESSEKTGVVILKNNAPTSTAKIKQSTITSSTFIGTTTNIIVGAALLTNADGTTVNTKSATTNTAYVYDTLLDSWETKTVTITPKLTYDANGGQTTTTTTVDFTALSGAYEPLSMLIAPLGQNMVREGYNHVGWNTAADKSGKPVNPESYITISKDTTLYAIWEGKPCNLYIDGTGPITVKVSGDLTDYFSEPLTCYSFYSDAEKKQKVNVDDGKMPYIENLYAFKKASVAVNWMVGDTLYSEGIGWDGNGFEFPQAPTKAGHTFTGWVNANGDSIDEQTVCSAENGTYTFYAEFAVNYYTVTWLNDDGTTLKTDSVKYNDVPSYSGETPVKTKNGCTAYDFSGWDKDIVAVTEDVTYIAKFTERDAHTLVDYEAKAPTCTEAGWGAYQACGECDYTTYQEIPALGHSYDAGAVTTSPTCTEAGVKTYTCATCGDTKTEAINALGHKDENTDHVCDNNCGVAQGTHADSTEDKDHVCDYCGQAIENGETCADQKGDGDHKCDVCGADAVTDHSYSAATCTTPATCSECNGTTGEVDENAHDWGEITYTWGDGMNSCIATRVCKHEGTHVDTAESINISTESGESVSCERDGTTIYVAREFSKSWAGYDHEEYPDEKVYVEEIVTEEATGHSWGSASYSWNADNTVCTATRKCSYNHTESVEATAVAVVTDPDCETGGYTTYTATFDGVEWASEQVKTGNYTSARGHNYQLVDSKAATCEEDGFKKSVCENCDHEKTEIIAASGHEWSEIEYKWSEVTENSAVCTATRTCKNDPTHTETATAQSVETEGYEAPKCDKDGSIVCRASDFDKDWASETVEKTVIITALGHAYGTDWENDGTNHWHECACGDKSGEAAHSDETNKDHKCDTCGYEMSECADSDDADHKCDHCGTDGITGHVYGEEWKTDTTNHWHECACGAKSGE